MYLAGHTGKQVAADTISKESAWPRRQFVVVVPFWYQLWQRFVKPDLSVKLQRPRDRCFRLRCGLLFFCIVLYLRSPAIAAFSSRSAFPDQIEGEISPVIPPVNYKLLSSAKGYIFKPFQSGKNSRILILLVVVIQLLRILFWLNSRRFLIKALYRVWETKNSEQLKYFNKAHSLDRIAWREMKKHAMVSYKESIGQILISSATV